MKKVLSIVAVVAIAASFTSCKKDYTCDCTYTYAGTSTTTSYTAKLKKKDAITWCEGSATTSSYKCELK